MLSELNLNASGLSLSDREQLLLSWKMDLQGMHRPRLPLIVSPCIRCAAPEKKNLKQILIFKSSVLTVISH